MTTHRDLADQAMQQATAAASTDPGRASILAGIAQTHATLELAEQQRIANLIALGREDVLYLHDDGKLRESELGYPQLAQPISRILGAP